MAAQDIAIHRSIGATHFEDRTKDNRTLHKNRGSCVDRVRPSSISCLSHTIRVQYSPGQTSAGWSAAGGLETSAGPVTSESSQCGVGIQCCPERLSVVGDSIPGVQSSANGFLARDMVECAIIP